MLTGRVGSDGAPPSHEASGVVPAVVVIVLREGRVLALRRSPTKDAGAGLWECVSGRIEAGEDPHAAARREALEETGLEVRVHARPIDAYMARRGERAMLVVCYVAEWIAGEVQRSCEHDEHAWLTPAEFEAQTTLSRLATSVHLAAALHEASRP